MQMTALRNEPPVDSAPACEPAHAIMCRLARCLCSIVLNHLPFCMATNKLVRV